ncbi:hypothetical protein BST47_05965 [Mycolicibacterium tusciae]|uniref:Uncharacterized protein n=1 Tax=Mycolicibacterium tusciae TaxID=75922 RepID=A0A1X0JUR6_9MYCO|nr:hypothetical protein BST47_05965 [Mycolicibacterium tusciae]
MAELVIALNPDENSRLPYLLRLPQPGGDLLFRTSGTWPRWRSPVDYRVAKLRATQSLMVGRAVVLERHSRCELGNSDSAPGPRRSAQPLVADLDPCWFSAGSSWASRQA